MKIIISNTILLLGSLYRITGPTLKEQQWGWSSGSVYNGFLGENKGLFFPEYIYRFCYKLHQAGWHGGNMKCHRNTKNAWRQLVQLESLPLYRLHCRQAVCRSCSGLCCMLQARVMWGSMRTKQGTQEPGGASRGLMLCFIFPLSQTNINKPSSHRRRNHPFINWYFSRLKCRRFTATV